MDLLLLADEQESMIDKYLERGEMFALYDDGLKAISVVTCEGEGIYEIKNIAVCPSSQRKGYGKRLVDYLFGYYQGRCSVMLVGTGDTPSTLSFYEHCGFRISHRLKNFFTDNYDHPIYGMESCLPTWCTCGKISLNSYFEWNLIFHIIYYK